MKRSPLVHLLFGAAALLPFAAHAGIIYSGVVSVPIPQDFEGVYLRLDTGVTQTSFPGDWGSAPWINPFFGGVAIGSSAQARPVITGLDQVLNLAPGTLIDAGSLFAAGESGSSTHTGSGLGQFAIGTPGYLGFAIEPPGGETHYLWLSMVVDNEGAGTITGWAYDETPGAGILAGQIAVVPEPTTACFGVALLALTASRRHRRTAV